MTEIFSILGTTVIMLMTDFSKVAQEVRGLFKLTETEEFPVLKILEYLLNEADSKYEFDIIQNNEWTYSKQICAFYNHSEVKHVITIREDVYENARLGDIRSLLIITHEISHWAIINVLNLNFDSKEFYKLDAFSKNILKNIHENLADILAMLLTFSQEKLSENNITEDVQKVLDKDLFSLVRFYCKNHTTLTSTFKKKSNLYPNKCIVKRRSA